MDWSIQEIAKLAGTTSRTLRHYDDIGLLAPARIGSNGYRYYDDAALVRLLQRLRHRLEALGDLAEMTLGRRARGAQVVQLVGQRAAAADEPLRSEPVPSHLQDAAAWIGQSERERGRALRGLLRTTDRILRSRGALKTRPRETFPRFSSERRRS